MPKYAGPGFAAIVHRRASGYWLLLRTAALRTVHETFAQLGLAPQDPYGRGCRGPRALRNCLVRYRRQCGAYGQCRRWARPRWPGRPAGQDQARLADHPGEQVLRRDVHRAEQQHATCGRRCPRRASLLKNYYGTGHFSLDNYVSMVSGQATQPDTQADCPFYDDVRRAAIVSTSRHDPNRGQLASAAGPERGRRAPTAASTRHSVPTLFNQLDAASVSWKGYAQDLRQPETGSAPHSAGGAAPAAPPFDASRGPTGSAAQPNPGSANATDQYVPKHFPFPWFSSVLSSGDCNAEHIANLSTRPTACSTTCRPSDHAGVQLDHAEQLQRRARRGLQRQQPLRRRSPTPNTPPTRRRVNYTGGLYASDLFLEYYIPMIEESPAFKDGGLIDITFDEALPAVHLHRQQLRQLDASIRADTPRPRSPRDTAGENIFGQHRALRADRPEHAAGDRRRTATSCTRARATTPSSTGRPTASPRPSRSQPAVHLPARRRQPGARPRAPTPRRTAASPYVLDAITDDVGRSSPTHGRTGDRHQHPGRARSSGTVSDTGRQPPRRRPERRLVDTGSFQLVDQTASRSPPTGAVSGRRRSARPHRRPTDPLFDATDATTGGGDTGSVLISP